MLSFTVHSQSNFQSSNSLIFIDGKMVSIQQNTITHQQQSRPMMSTELTARDYANMFNNGRNIQHAPQPVIILNPNTGWFGTGVQSNNLVIQNSTNSSYTSQPNYNRELIKLNDHTSSARDNFIKQLEEINQRRRRY